MDPLHRAFHTIRANVGHPTAEALRALIASLDGGGPFDMNSLYALNYADFSLAMEVIRAWRLDGYRYQRGWATRVAIGELQLRPSVDDSMAVRSDAAGEGAGQ